MKLKEQLYNPYIWYIIINILVSAVGFGRSFLFMKWLDMNDLGIVSLVQTLIMFLGLFQIGLLNGGYRIFALDKIEEQKTINNILFTYFGLLSLFCLFAWAIICFSGHKIIISNELLFISLLCGILSLTMNWLTNTLIGKRLIGQINKINALSAIVSLMLLPLIIVWGIYGAVIAIGAQSLVFITITLIKYKELRPTNFNFNLKLVRYILSFGFIPFLAGIFAVINIQVERWSIAKMLGTEALGQYYLVFLYTTLFMLIPASLNSLFFPKSVNAYEYGNIELFRRYLRQYIIILICYLGMVLLLTLTILQPIIDWIFPAHSENTKYVFYFLPGLIFFVLADPISLIMNSMVKLRPMLIAGVLGSIINILFIVIAEKNSIFSLVTMSIIKDIVNFSIFFVYVLFLFKNYEKVIKI